MRLIKLSPFINFHFFCHNKNYKFITADILNNHQDEKKLCKTCLSDNKRIE